MTPKTIREWTLEDEIGVGTMGIVYRATHKYSASPYAVKRIHVEFSRDAERRRYFEREAAIAVSLNHPNIVRTSPAFSDDEGGLYLPMELLEGQSLDDFVHAHAAGVRDEAQIIAIARSVSSALAYTHKLTPPIVHRDLKPANIFRLTDGSIKVLDFGLARAFDDDGGQSSSAGRVPGTPAYMAPEVLDGQPAAPTADVYSLGVLLFQVATGRLPFDIPDRASVMSVLQAIGKAHQQGVLKLRSVWPGASPRLEDLIARMMATRPEDRPPDGHQLRSLLQTSSAPAPTAQQTYFAPGGLPSRPTTPAPQIPRQEEPKTPNPSQPSWSLRTAAAPWVSDEAIIHGFGILSKRVATLSKRDWLVGLGAVALFGAITWTFGGSRPPESDATVVAQPDEASLNSARAGASTPANPSADAPEPPSATPGIARTAPSAVPAARKIERPLPKVKKKRAPSTTVTRQQPAEQTSPPEADAVKRGRPGMVYVPAGTFMMGCVPGGPECHRHQKPRHQVYVSGYYIDRKEVTVGQYKACVRAKRCTDTGAGRALGFMSSPRCTLRIEESDRFPVNCISWHNANNYCKFRGKRLPTEAEWERAARGTNQNIYPWGRAAPAKTLVSRGRLAMGCSKRRGAHGLCDMAGNLWEWTADCFRQGIYAERKRASSLTRDPYQQGLKCNRVQRGGSYASSTVTLTAAYRRPRDPDSDRRDFGFRCAISAAKW